MQDFQNKKIVKTRKGYVDITLLPKLIAKIKEAGIEIAMCLINTDGTPMTADQFVKTVESDPQMAEQFTMGGEKDIFPFKLTLTKCKCQKVYTADTWPDKDDYCKHGHFFIKMEPRIPDGLPVLLN